MPSNQEVVISLLRSIDHSLRQIAGGKGGSTKAVAPDSDLDGQYGDPAVKFNPRDWTGDSFKGCNLSQCPPAFLDMLAETFDYFGDQAEKNNETTNSGKPVAPYKRKDAARARGWAKRNREGWKPPTFEAAEKFMNDFTAPQASPTDWASAPSGFEDSEPITADDIPF